MNLHLEQWANTWQKPMLRFARLHLSNEADAEDAVQETFLSLLNIQPNVFNIEDPRKYLFGALKNKVMDRLRLRYKHPSASNSEQTEDDLDRLLFDDQGHWVDQQAPAHWDTPAHQLESSQFFQVLDICVNDLPKKPAQVFSMKEFLECDAPEICETLQISKTDYWQCLSRARKHIHLCLNQRWFGGHTL